MITPSIGVRFRLPCILALGCACLAIPLLAEEAKSAKTDEIVALPRYEVSETRIYPEVERWKYGQIAGFEVLSTASDRDTRYFTREFSRLQQVLSVLWPTMRQTVPEVPVAIILCGKGNEFEVFRPMEERKEPSARNTLFRQNKESAAIIVDFAATELFTGDIRLSDVAVKEAAPEVDVLQSPNVDNGAAQSAQDQSVVRLGVTRADPFRSFRAEYIRYLLGNSAGSRLPEWFKEGLLRLFMNIDYTKKVIEVGRIGDVDGPKAEDFNIALSERGIIPFAEMFKGRPAKDSVLSGYDWSMQCYAFVHYGLFGEKRSHAPALLRFLETSSKEGVSEDLFKSCFDMDYKDAELALRGYIGYTNHTYAEFKTRDGVVFVDQPDIALREATDAEVGRVKGEALRLCGLLEDARGFQIAPYVRGERDPNLLAVLGLTELEAQQPVRARKFLEAAVKGNTTRARAYVELACLRADAMLAQGKGKGLTREQVAEVLPLLLRARGLPPLLPEIYETAANTWLAASVTPTREEYNLVLQGALLFPRNLGLVYRSALLAAKTGFYKDARLLVEHGERWTPSGTGRERFMQLRRDYPGINAPDPVVPAVQSQSVPAKAGT